MTEPKFPNLEDLRKQILGEKAEKALTPEERKSLVDFRENMEKLRTSANVNHDAYLAFLKEFKTKHPEDHKNYVFWQILSGNKLKDEEIKEGMVLDTKDNEIAQFLEKLIQTS